jgi:hypothetical protein
MRILLHGADTEAILRVTEEVQRCAEEAQTPSFAAFVREAEGLVFMWRGEFTRAQITLALAHDHAAQNGMPHTEIAVGGLLAECWLELGDSEQALLQAQKTLERLKGVQLTMSHIAFGLCGVISVHLQSAEKTGRVSPSLRSALEYLERLAGRALAASSSLERCRGRVAWLDGNSAHAVRHMERSRALALRMSQPRDEALARYFLGRFARSDAARSLLREPARLHLEAALAILNRLGAHGDAARVREELGRERT